MHPSLRLAAASLVALLPTPATAQIINWGPVMPSVAPGDVSTNGALVVARNLHGTNASPPVDATVNGVTFVGGFRPMFFDGWITTGLAGSTTGDAEYDKLLNGSRAMQNPMAPPNGNPTPWGGIRIDDLAPLTVGGLYEIQVWFTDQRTGTPTNVLHDRVMTMSSAFGTATVVGGELTNLGSMVMGPLSGALEADPDDAPAINSPDTVFGSHCTGQFVYVPGAETWLLIQGSHPDPTNVLQPHLTAVQIRDVSPASFGTTGTGCPSSAGIAVLSSSSLPVVGGTFRVDMDNLSPTGLPLMAFGLQTSPPFMISTVGLTNDPSCMLTVTLDVLVGPLPVVGASTSVSFPIPGAGSLVGSQLFVQGAQFEATGLSLTARGEATIGF